MEVSNSGDTSGCISMDSITILVIDREETLYIPNSFTPNEDGKNDLFYIYGKGIIRIDLKIFNRWGEIVFATSDMNEPWTGKYKNSIVPEGVYVCLISCSWNGNRKPETLTTHLMVIK